MRVSGLGRGDKERGRRRKKEGGGGGRMEEGGWRREKEGGGRNEGGGGRRKEGGGGGQFTSCWQTESESYLILDPWISKVTRRTS